MHFKWSTSDVKGNPSYRLVLDRKTLQELNKKLQKAQRELDEKALRNRQDFLKTVLSMDKISDSDLEKLRETNTYLYGFEMTGGGELVRTLNREQPEAIAALMNETNYYVMASDLSPQLQQALVNAARGYRNLYENRGFGKKTLLNDMENTIGTAWVRVRGKTDATREARLRDLGSIILKLGPEYNTKTAFLLARMHPTYSNYDQKIAALYYKTPGDEVEAKKLIEQAKDDLDPAWAELTKEVNELCPGDLLTEHLDEEWMHDTVDMTKSKPFKLRDVMEVLADASRLSVISDSFVSAKPAPNFSPSETLGEVLKTITDKCDYNWSKQGSTLELIDRYWLYKRDRQISAEWVEHWSNNTKRNKALSFDDFAQIASMTDEQVEENLSEDVILGSPEVFQVIMKNLNTIEASNLLIRLYGKLGHEQRKMLWSTVGVPMQMLTPEQTNYAQAYVDEIMDWGPAYSWIQSPDITFHLSLMKGQDKGDKYTISIGLGEQEGNLYSDYVMPVYKPPQNPPVPVGVVK